MQTLEELLKSLVQTRPEGLDPKVQMEYDQVNQNYRTLADIRFKLLALVPPLGGLAIFAVSRMAVPEDLDSSQYALALSISVLGFLATLGITFYDQRNSELYNGLGGRGNYLEYCARLDPNPTLEPTKESFAGQFLERPKSARRLMGLPILLMKHDRGLALIYGPILGAWFFPMTYAILGWADKGSTNVRPWIAIAVAALMVFIFIAELLRLDDTFSETRWGEVTYYNPNDGVLQLAYSVRKRRETFSGELLSRCNGREDLKIGACVRVRYKKHRLVEVWNPERSRNCALDTATPKPTIRVNRVLSVKLLREAPKQKVI